MCTARGFCMCRIVVTDLAGAFQVQIGGNGAGLRDGSPGEAAFFAPQGLAYCRRLNVLYVADTENHALREVRGYLPWGHRLCCFWGGGFMRRRQYACCSMQHLWGYSLVQHLQKCAASPCTQSTLCTVQHSTSFLKPLPVQTSLPAEVSRVHVVYVFLPLLQVDLTSGRVRTLAGNGFRGSDYEGGRTGREQQLNSPWDVVMDTQVEFVPTDGCSRLQSSWGAPGALEQASRG